MGKTLIMSSKCILAGNVCLRHYDDIADATLGHGKCFPCSYSIIFVLGDPVLLQRSSPGYLLT